MDGRGFAADLLDGLLLDLVLDAAAAERARPGRPSGSMIIIEPAFCGVDPRVSTTWQTISSRSCSRASIKCRTRSRMRCGFQILDSRFQTADGTHCQANPSHPGAAMHG